MSQDNNQNQGQYQNPGQGPYQNQGYQGQNTGHQGQPQGFQGQNQGYQGQPVINIINTNTNVNVAGDGGISNKSKIVCILLCIFLGGLGIHRFYVGKVGTGVLMLLTGGCCGIWVIIDLIMICIGSFTDGAGRRITV